MWILSVWFENGRSKVKKKERAEGNPRAKNEDSNESQTSEGIESGLFPEEQTTVDYSIHWMSSKLKSKAKRMNRCGENVHL